MALYPMQFMSTRTSPQYIYHNYCKCYPKRSSWAPLLLSLAIDKLPTTPLRLCLGQRTFFLSFFIKYIFYDTEYDSQQRYLIKYIKKVVSLQFTPVLLQQHIYPTNIRKYSYSGNSTNMDTNNI